MSNEVVPFGKHKGKSVDALLDDRPYLDWLLSQSWFKEKFGNVYNIVINNGQEPSETPEHNAMQIKFLSKQYRQKFACELFQKIYRCDSMPEFEVDGIDVFFELSPYRIDGVSIEIKPSVGDDFPAILRQIKRYQRNAPTGTFVLFTKEYTGQGASKNEFIDFFFSQGIKLVFEADVDELDLSDYE